MPTFPDGFDEPPRALVITAHPDDADFGPAGTVASWTALGVRVAYCVVTSGAAGGFDAEGHDELGQVREQEQRDAAEAVGVRDVRFLGHSDGQVVADQRLRRDLTRTLREVRPHAVLTHTPEINWTHVPVSHPDHRAVGEAAFAAVYPDARNEFAHPDLAREHRLDPWTVSELWLIGAPEERVNHAVDITEHFPAKVTALAAHRSQIAHIADIESMIRGQAERVAAQHGLPGRLAEAFHVVDTS